MDEGARGDLRDRIVAVIKGFVSPAFLEHTKVIWVFFLYA